jgi:hypothetical protein
MHISAWLRGLGLERYEAAFRDNEIDRSLLPKLTADDLKDIGVAALGHCRAAGERDELILPVAMTSAARAAGGGAALHGLAVSTGLRGDCVFLPKPVGRRRTSRSSRG